MAKTDSGVLRGVPRVPQALAMRKISEASIARPADSACRAAVVLISTTLLVASQQHAGRQTGILTVCPCALM